VTIAGQRVDLIVEGLVIVELKTVKKFEDIHEAQVLSYLKTTGLRAGLLINFHVPVLYRGIKRIVL
jgi:GxxExxY protein